MDISQAREEMEYTRINPGTTVRPRSPRHTYYDDPQREFADLSIHYASTSSAPGQIQESLRPKTMADALTVAHRLQQVYDSCDKELEFIEKFFTDYNALEWYASEQMDQSPQSIPVHPIVETSSPDLQTDTGEDDEERQQLNQYYLSELEMVLALKEKLQKESDTPIPEYYSELIQQEPENISQNTVKEPAWQKLIDLVRQQESLPRIKFEIEDLACELLKTVSEENMSLQFMNDVLRNALRSHILPTILMKQSIYFEGIQALSKTILITDARADKFMKHIQLLIRGHIDIKPFSADDHGGLGPVQLTFEDQSKIVVKFRPGEADVLFMEMLGKIKEQYGEAGLPYYNQRFLDGPYLISEYVEGNSPDLFQTVPDVLKGASTDKKRNFLKLEYISRKIGLTDMHPENYKLWEDTVYPIDLESYNPATVTGFLDNVSGGTSESAKLAFIKAAGFSTVTKLADFYADEFASELFPVNHEAILHEIAQTREIIDQTVKRYVPLPTTFFLELWSKEESARKDKLVGSLSDALSGKFEFDPEELATLCDKMLANAPGYVPMFLIQAGNLYYNAVEEMNLVGTRISP